MPPYLRPMAPTAAAGILCGDPARALLLAQELLTEPRMSNHHRGLWGYYGVTGDGLELTVHATGIGGPSAALVLGELQASGLRRAVRVGSCASAGEGHRPASILAAEAVRDEAGSAADPLDRGLTGALVSGADAAVTVTSLSQAPAAAATGAGPGTGSGGIFDMQTAALAAAARHLGVALGVLLVVADSDGVPLEDDPFEAAAIRAGRIALTALTPASGS